MATLEKTLTVAVGGQFMVFSAAIMLYHAVITEGAITIGRVLSEIQLPLQTEPNPEETMQSSDCDMSRFRVPYPKLQTLAINLVL